MEPTKADGADIGAEPSCAPRGGLRGGAGRGPHSRAALTLTWVARHEQLRVLDPGREIGKVRAGAGHQYEERAVADEPARLPRPDGCRDTDRGLRLEHRALLVEPQADVLDRGFDVVGGEARARDRLADELLEGARDVEVEARDLERLGVAQRGLLC